MAPVDQLLDVGEHDPVEAAASALSYLTAWRMLRKADLRGWRSCFDHGDRRGVALAALDLVRHFGAHAIVTSRSTEKLERAASLGASEGILDTGDDWSRAVRAGPKSVAWMWPLTVWARRCICRASKVCVEVERWCCVGAPVALMPPPTWPCLLESTQYSRIHDGGHGGIS